MIDTALASHRSPCCDSAAGAAAVRKPSSTGPSSSWSTAARSTNTNLRYKFVVRVSKNVENRPQEAPVRRGRRGGERHRPRHERRQGLPRAGRQFLGGPHRRRLLPHRGEVRPRLLSGSAHCVTGVGRGRDPGRMRTRVGDGIHTSPNDPVRKEVVRSPRGKRVGRGPAPPLRRVGVRTDSSGPPAVYRAGFPAGDAARWGQASQVSSISDRASPSAGLAVSR